MSTPRPLQVPLTRQGPLPTRQPTDNKSVARPPDQEIPAHRTSPPPSRVNTPRRLRDAAGYFIMLFSAAFNAGMSLLVRIAQTRHAAPVPVVVLSLGMVVTTLSMLALPMLGPISPSPATHNSHRRALAAQLVLRGALSSLTALLLFVALHRLPVGTVQTLFMTSPALTAVLSAALLDEPVSLQLAATLAVNFCGVALVARPTLAVSSGGVGAALAAALTAASGFVLVRRVGAAVHAIYHVAATGIACTVLGCALVLASDVDLSRVPRPGWMYACSAAVFSFAGQLCLSSALQLVPAGPAIVVRSINVPISFVLAWLLLGETHAGSTLVGVFLVMISVAVVALLQMHDEASDPQAEADFLLHSDHREGTESNDAIDK